ncbi:MAG: hypothetical protein R3296_11125 [Oleiphilaceae bacterium]|nr:hypothetical protein [Oleiphilaceae bacterium]
MTADWPETLHEAGLDTRTPTAPGVLPESFVAPVSDQTLLRIQGPDTRKFLQGQVTCDINALSDQQSLAGAACDPKGRVYALFQLLSVAEDEVLMQLPVAIVETVMKQMQKYLAFFKAEMTPAPEWFMLGLHGEAAVSTMVGREAAADAPGQVRPLEEGFAIARMPSPDGAPRHELWLNRLPDLTVDKASAAAWRLSRIGSGLVALSADTVGGYLPQQLNLHALDGVSFKKGCYTGQEVVARLHYLGKLKKSLFRLRIEGTATDPAPEERIESPQGKSLGNLVESIMDSDGHCHGLAVLSHEALNTGLRLASQPEARVSLEPMGYTVPDQQPG